MGAASVENPRAWIAARHGEWRAALRAGVDSAEQFLQRGDVLLLSPLLRIAGLACLELGSPEAAAVLLGKADTTSDRQLAALPWGLEMLAEADVALREVLGEEQAIELAARGAAMEANAAVAYLRAEVDRVLAAP